MSTARPVNPDGPIAVATPAWEDLVRGRTGTAPWSVSVTLCAAGSWRDPRLGQGARIRWHADGSQSCLSIDEPVSGVIARGGVVTVIVKGVAVLVTDVGQALGAGAIAHFLHPEESGTHDHRGGAVRPDRWLGRECWHTSVSDPEWPAPIEMLFDRETGVLLRSWRAPDAEWLEEIEVNIDLTDHDFAWTGPVALGDRPGTATVTIVAATGLITADHEIEAGPGLYHLEGPSGLSLARALDWARRRARQVRVVRGDEAYSAGEVALPGLIDRFRPNASR